MTETEQQEMMQVIWLIIDIRIHGANARMIQAAIKEKLPDRSFYLDEVMFLLGRMAGDGMITHVPDDLWTGRWADVKWTTLP